MRSSASRRTSGRRASSGRRSPRRRADVYLGLRALRVRSGVERAPPARSPRPLPLAACRIEASRLTGPTPSGPLQVTIGIGPWEPTWTEAAATPPPIGQAREAIAAGEVYQVNLVQHLSAPFEGDAGGVAAALAALRPAPWTTHPGAPDWSIVSASPELFLARRGDSDLDDAHQGHPPARRGARAARVGQGRRGARDDRGSRAQRPRSRLRAGQRPLAGAHAGPIDGRRGTPRLPGRGQAPRGASPGPRCCGRCSPAAR